MKIRNVLMVAGLILWLCGCYTQFRTLEERYPARPGEIGSLAEESDTNYVERDSLYEADSLVEKDTVVVTEREVCYWERTFFGDWELRCYDSNYPDYWHRYYNRPWWYRSYNYNAYDCHCPYHVFYHTNCEYCWHYCDSYSYHGGGYIHGHHPHGHSTGSGTSGSQGSSPVKGKVLGSGRKGNSTKPQKPITAPGPHKVIPSSTPAAPSEPAGGKTPASGKKPGEGMSNSGKVPQNTNNDASKPAKGNKNTKKRRFGRRR